MLSTQEREQLLNLLASHTVSELIEAAADIAECQNWETHQALRSEMCNTAVVQNQVTDAINRWYWRANEAYKLLPAMELKKDVALVYVPHPPSQQMLLPL
jgi:hypothetical protein